ncbi:MAG: DUF5915 domain-containing protein, partial [Clostridiales bacterium]|nr:DUF5915 domain-containing protein [Clostridiales bacterium]
EADKMTAYYTLFCALNACVKIMAPIIPFMTEVIWQKLTRVVMPSSPISVHLADWPTPMKLFEDDGIIAQTAAARDVIATAMRLRNEQQIKVRQPLSKLYVCSDSEGIDEVKVFEKNILDELNIRTIEYISDFSVLEDTYLSVNFKAAGAVLKREVNNFKAALENASYDEMQSMVSELNAGQKVHVKGFDGEFDDDLFVKNTRTKDGIVSSKCVGNIVVALDVTLSDELIQDGIIRDIVRQCQLLRKEAGYSVEQRIRASISVAGEFITSALNKNKAHISSELLANELLINESISADATKEIEAGGEKVTISVSK